MKEVITRPITPVKIAYASVFVLLLCFAVLHNHDHIEQEVKMFQPSESVLLTYVWIDGHVVKCQMVYDKRPSNGYSCCNIWTACELTDSIKSAQYELAKKRLDKHTNNISGISGL
jgi:hypothetical protein